MKGRHRRFRLWLLFGLFSALLLYALDRGILSRLMNSIPNPSPGAPARQLPMAAETLPLEPLEIFRFEDPASLAQWEQKVFKGGTRYDLVDEGGRPYLAATSSNSSCGLYMKTRHEATPDLYLKWKWRVREFPPKRDRERLANRSEDDFAARLYVIFLASNLFRSDVIEYVWDESIPAGRAEDSPYSERIKLFVVRSGASCAESGGWCEELRNPLEDYKRLFGKPPKNPIGILALMSDSDNTASRAAADFEEILIGRNKR